MAITRNERVLIAISHIASGSNDYLYNFIETSGRTTMETVLGDDYERIVRLYGANATLDRLVNAIQAQGARTAIKRIDLIVMLHGSPGRLVFRDGTHTSMEVRDRIRALNLGAKLRWVYSTACYGNSHSAHFIAAGFNSAIGSRKVNANAAVEFIPLLSLWQFGTKLSDCLAPTVPPTAAADALARGFGQLTNKPWKNDVDSRKVLRGNRNLRIST
ncbi:MAG TPA: hypothetical protein VNT99_06485 [Methylomirabilota bacterium]|nr:hypothetical protein [Methylomirabilota bacterium]